MKLRQAMAIPKEYNQRSKSGEQEFQSFPRSMEDIAQLKLKKTIFMFSEKKYTALSLHKQKEMWNSRQNGGLLQCKGDAIMPYNKARKNVVIGNGLL